RCTGPAVSVSPYRIVMLKLTLSIAAASLSKPCFSIPLSDRHVEARSAGRRFRVVKDRACPPGRLYGPLVRSPGAPRVPHEAAVSQTGFLGRTGGGLRARIPAP